jgi:hypothetical protein
MSQTWSWRCCRCIFSRMRQGRLALLQRTMPLRCRAATHSARIDLKPHDATPHTVACGRRCCSAPCWIRSPRCVRNSTRRTCRTAAWTGRRRRRGRGPTGPQFRTPCAHGRRPGGQRRRALHHWRASGKVRCADRFLLVQDHLPDDVCQVKRRGRQMGSRMTILAPFTMQLAPCSTDNCKRQH